MTESYVDQNHRRPAYLPRQIRSRIHKDQRSVFLSTTVQTKAFHVRWSGEALWIPLGDQKFGLEFENHTAHPSAGQILFYPGGFSETEILFCYGNVAFASRMGALAANHFVTIVEGGEQLRALGEMVL